VSPAATVNSCAPKVRVATPVADDAFFLTDKDAAREITDRLAFWKGVEVS
jgi:hypothetical protein